MAGCVRPFTRYTRSTLEWASQLLMVAEITSSLRSPTHKNKNKTAGAVSSPDHWSKAQLKRWLLVVDGGRFGFLAPHLPLDGMTMRHTPTTGAFAYNPSVPR